LKTESGKGKQQTASIALIVIVLVAAVVILFAAFSRGSSTKSSSTTSTASVSTSLSATQQAIVAQIGIIEYDLTDLNNQNLTNLYTSTAVLTWGGPGINATASAPIDYAGTYTGSSQIGSLYSNWFGYLAPSRPLAPGSETTSALTSNIVVTVTSPTSANATFGLYIGDDTSEFGAVNANIVVHQQWTNQGGTWYISQDSWDWTTSSIQFPL